MWPRGNQLTGLLVSHTASHTHILGKACQPIRAQWTTPPVLCNSGISVLLSTDVHTNPHADTEEISGVFPVFSWCLSPGAVWLCCNVCSIHPHGKTEAYLWLTGTLNLLNFTAQTACFLPLCSDCHIHLQPPAWVQTTRFTSSVHVTRKCATLMHASG